MMVIVFYPITIFESFISELLQVIKGTSKLKNSMGL